MVINAGVYQIFLSRIDWADESKRAWRRVGCKISVSQRPYQSDFAKSSLEYTEKSGILRRVILTYLIVILLRIELTISILPGVSEIHPSNDISDKTKYKF